jgi:hypothetical protein
MKYTYEIVIDGEKYAVDSESELTDIQAYNHAFNSLQELDREKPSEGFSAETQAVLESYNLPTTPSAITFDSTNEQGLPIIEQRESDRQGIIDLAKSRFSPETVKMWESTPIDIGEVGNFIEWSQILPAGGFVQGAQALKLMDISEKINQGEEVKDSDKAYLDQWIDKSIEMDIRGMTFGGKFRYYGEQMPAFMAEFAATGGVGKSAQVAAVKGTQSLIKNKVLSQAAGATARVAAQSAMLMPTQGFRAYGNVRMSEGLEVTDTGQAIFREAKESPAISALKAYGYVSAEVASELSGLAVASKLAKSPTFQQGKMALKSAAITSINKLPAKLKNNLYGAYKAIQPNARMSEIFTRAGWNGMLLELGEERVADVLRESVDLALTEGYTMSDVLEGITPDAEQLLLESGLIMTMGGAKAGGNLLANMLVKKGMTPKEAQDSVESMSSLEQDALIDDQITVNQTVSVNKSVVDESLDQIEDANVAEELPDTRGQGQQYHGTSSEIINLVEYTYSPLNIYGQGFYTTDAVDVSEGYSKKGKGKLPFIYKVNVVNDPVLYDLDSPISLNDRVAVEDILDDLYPLYENEMGEFAHLNTLGEIFDTVRQESDQSADYIQESFEAVQELLSQDGYDGYTHVGGKFTKTSPHKVEIYWTPKNHIELEKIDIESQKVALDQAIKESIKNIDNPAPNLITSAQQDQLAASRPVAQVDANESIFNDLYYQWIDDMGALVDLSKAAAKTGKDNMLESSVRLYQGVSGMALSSLNNGTTILNEQGELEQTGKGLRAIMEDFDFNAQAIEPNKKAREQDLVDYMIARRYALDLTNRDDVEVTEAQSKKSIETLAYMSAKYGDTMTLIDTSVQEIYEYQDRLLQMLVSFDVMSQKKYDTIKKENPNYIPFQRVMDEEYGIESGLQGMQLKTARTFAGKKLNQVIKKIQGSDKEIINPIESIVRNTFRIADIAYQNRIAKQLVELADVMPEYVSKTSPAKISITDPKTGEKNFRIAEVQPADVFTALIKGEKKYYKAHPSIIAAMSSMSPEQITGLGWLLSTPATVLRTGATITPEFMARNFIRDVHGSYVFSEARPTPFDAAKGLLARIGKTELYEQWRASGASFNSYMNISDKGMQKAYQEIFKQEGKLTRYLKNPLNLPQDIGSVLEQGVRIGVYNAAKRKGMTDAQGGIEARDASIDFARGGKASKFINRYVPFFNAGMQGADKFFRAAKKNPKGFILSATATVTIPQVLITGYYLFVAPEEEKKEYLEIPEWQRDMFWIFKVGDTWARYPKPFSIGFAFGSSVERIMIWADSQNDNSFFEVFRGISSGIVASVSPVYEPSAIVPSPIKTAAELTANYNWFQGRRIYPEWMEKLPNEEQKNAGTSLTAQELGKVFDYSPAKIDHIIRSSLATSGPYITDAGDALLKQVKEWNGEEIPKEPTSPVDMPLLRALTMRYPTGGMANSVQEFYELYTNYEKVKNGLKIFKDERLDSYRDENQALISVFPDIKRAGKRIARYNEKRKAVYKDLEMSGKEKETELRFLDDNILEEARLANEALLEALEDLQ